MGEFLSRLVSTFFFPRETLIKLYGTNDCLHSNPTNKLKTLSDGEQEIVIVDREEINLNLNFSSSSLYFLFGFETLFCFKFFFIQIFQL